MTLKKILKWTALSVRWSHLSNQVVMALLNNHKPNMTHSILSQMESRRVMRWTLRQTQIKKLHTLPACSATQFRNVHKDVRVTQLWVLSSWHRSHIRLALMMVHTCNWQHQPRPCHSDTGYRRLEISQRSWVLRSFNISRVEPKKTPYDHMVALPEQSGQRSKVQ